MSHFRPSSSSRSTSEESVNKRIVANFHELGLLSTDEKRRGVPRQKQKQTYRRTVDRSYSNGPPLTRSTSVPSRSGSSAARPLVHARPSFFTRKNTDPASTVPLDAPYRPVYPQPTTPHRPSLVNRPSNILKKVHEKQDPSAPRRPNIRFATPPPGLNRNIDRFETDTHFERVERPNRPAYNSKVQTSFSWRAGGAMAGMLDGERSRTRRERTFIGSQCAVCDEPLEHTLRGERILQFSCGHVSHEACFYEFIKEVESQHCPTCNAPLGLDTSRGGSILDLEKLSSIVRSVAIAEPRDQSQPRRQPPTPTWEKETIHEPPPAARPHPSHRDGPPHIRERGSSLNRGHARNDSNTSAHDSATEFAEPPHNRRHDYDVQAMETNVSARNSMSKKPMPAPTITIRSEFPTLTRSRQQQSLTCLVTVEVPEGKWRPDPNHFRGAPLTTGSTALIPPTPVDPPSDPTGAFSRIASPHPGADYEPFEPFESPEELDDITEDLRTRVDNWHGLDFSRFGRLRLFSTIRVGKDRQSWQELECYLFAEMLICVKEKKNAAPQWDASSQRKLTRCTLKGSILIKKHLKRVNEVSPDEPILTLSLSVAELPSFHLLFPDRDQLVLWKRALLDLNGSYESAPLHSHSQSPVTEPMDSSETDEEDYRTLKTTKRVSSMNSSFGPSKSTTTAPTEYTAAGKGLPNISLPSPVHVPLDIVVVIPVSSSMQGLKITLLRDALRFLVQNLGGRDRMGLVTFGSGGGGVPMVGMTTKSWSGWPEALNSIRPFGQKSLRADVVEGANVAMDLLMQRKNSNPIGTILLISDSSTADADSVDFVVSRAEAAKVAIHSFGLGLTHKPDTMIELSTRTKASYVYVKDWMMLRECLAGVMGSMQTLSHSNVKLKLKLPEGSPAKFVKISGALQITKRATGKEAEAALGDLRFGDKRDILVQLVIAPDNSSQEQLPQDAWESIISGLEALGPLDSEDPRGVSVEEVPLIQADLTYGDILRDSILTHLPRPSLLAITMLPQPSRAKGRASSPPIPPHPSIVQRRMELLTSDMMTRALTLVSRTQHERAHHLLQETRSILKGLGKGGLPPVPPTSSGTKPRTNSSSAPTPSPEKKSGSTTATNNRSRSASTSTGSTSPHPDSHQDSHPDSPSPASHDQERTSSPVFTPAPGIDVSTLAALDAELESALEWINHPAVFGRDSRKAVLQAIGVISSQRAYTFRTAAESLWAGRVSGVRRLMERSRNWREVDEGLREEV